MFNLRMRSGLEDKISDPLDARATWHLLQFGGRIIWECVLYIIVILFSFYLPGGRYYKQICGIV